MWLWGAEEKKWAEISYKHCFDAYNGITSIISSYSQISHQIWNSVGNHWHNTREVFGLVCLRVLVLLQWWMSPEKLFGVYRRKEKSRERMMLCWDHSMGRAGLVLQEMDRQQASALGHQDHSTAGMRNPWTSYQGIGKLQDTVLMGDFYYPDICWVTNAANHGNNVQP